MEEVNLNDKCPKICTIAGAGENHRIMVESECESTLNNRKIILLILVCIPILGWEQRFTESKLTLSVFCLGKNHARNMVQWTGKVLNRNHHPKLHSFTGPFPIPSERRLAPRLQLPPIR